jgi:RNA polymerase sigma-70 factor (ECF subfamily)
MSESGFPSLGTLFSMTDEQAMWRVQMHDDPSAFAHLVTRWEGPIQRLCIRMIGDEHRAEDLAQEAFTRVYAKRKDYQASARFSTFLWRVALNLCYDEIRRLKRRPEVRFDDGAEDSVREPIFASSIQQPDEELVSREQAHMVDTALRSLPETYQSVLVLRHYQNLKFREIAEVLGIPEGTVKSRMAEGLHLLNKKINFSMKAESRETRSIPPRECLVL